MYVCMFLWFLGDMYTPESGESEPDWVQTEQKHFSEFRDTNKVQEKKIARLSKQFMRMGLTPKPLHVEISQPV